jgi:hypothetical protein
LRPPVGEYVNHSNGYEGYAGGMAWHADLGVTSKNIQSSRIAPAALNFRCNSMRQDPALAAARTLQIERLLSPQSAPANDPLNASIPPQAHHPIQPVSIPNTPQRPNFALNALEKCRHGLGLVMTSVEHRFSQGVMGIRMRL